MTEIKLRSYSVEIIFDCKDFKSAHEIASKFLGKIPNNARINSIIEVIDDIGRANG